MEPLLRAINLHKKFGSLQAIRQVSFDIYAGEVVGLAGNSGSGKSVLVMLLAGLYAPNGGDLYFNGRRLQWPFAANTLGIGVIHQRPELVDLWDIPTNIFLGNEIGWPPLRTWWKILNHHKMIQEAQRILHQLGVTVTSLHQPVSNLSAEERQMIAIARVLTYPVQLVIIDEPTVLLSYPYQQRLLSLVEYWRQRNTAIIFSSNNLDHLFTVSDRIITLQHGQKVADLATDQTSREEVVSLIVGYQDLPHAVIKTESYYHSHEQKERLHYYQMLLEKDLAAQDTLNEQLIEQMTTQLRTLDQANLALQDAQRRLLTEREEERKHLARELHDQVIQDLLSVNYQIEEIADEETVLIANELTNVRQKIRALVTAIRGICGTLRPPTIDSLGLGAALQSYTRDWADHTGIELSLELDQNLSRLPEPIELSIFRIIQEGLQNVGKHAQATHVDIILEHTSPRHIFLSISDDGVGLPDDFDLDRLSAHGHYGLVGISERVALLGGKLRLPKQEMGGMVLQAEIPHPRTNTDSFSFARR